MSGSAGSGKIFTMQIVIFTHPSFSNSQSMPRYAKMLHQGLTDRGHQVDVWTPQAYFFKLSKQGFLQKWLGYIDQYILFPRQMKQRMKQKPKDTLYVFSDHALGPWVPLVATKPHVIHCHDFLAQLSALGKIPENPVSRTGRAYQQYIRQGYSKGKNFISVSCKTQEDLHQFLPSSPFLSEVVYNSINPLFKITDVEAARARISSLTHIDASAGYLLHVGGNQWYKNRSGVIGIYNAWREKYKQQVPILMIGEKPGNHLLDIYHQSPYKDDIHLLSGLADQDILSAYNGALLLLFPSLAEGFGWPIAEAMKSGCPVITTDEKPMTEVAGNCAFLLRRYTREEDYNTWAKEGADLVNDILSLDEASKQKVREDGVNNAARFTAVDNINKIESIYKNILEDY
jgi:glycosyltransferase involved in cell wall biosynthesis